MQSEWSKGTANMRDNVFAHIIGMQNDLGNDVKDKGYQELQKLLELYRRKIWKNVWKIYWMKSGFHWRYDRGEKEQC